MDVFVTGAGGYIGGAVALRLLRAGYRVTGLVRGRDKADALTRLGIVPVLGDLDDAGLLTREARRAEAVVNAASSDHRGAVAALLSGLSGSGKLLLHTSGSSIVADEACGEFSDQVYDEGSLPAPLPDKAPRVAIDRLVLDAATSGVRGVVVCNAMIYGRSPGLHAESVQIPALIVQARRSGVVRHVGRGLNVWSTVHIDDVAELYRLAFDKAPAGTFLFAENGEASLASITAAIAEGLRLGAPQPWPIEDAVREWGYQRAVYSLGANSRVRSRRARELLGWAPRHRSVIDWIRQDLAAAGA